MLKIRLDSPVPIYEQLIDEIIDKIQSGYLKSGETTLLARKDNPCKPQEEPFRAQVAEWLASYANI